MCICFLQQGDSGGYGGIRSSDGTAIIYGVSSYSGKRSDGACKNPVAYTDVFKYMNWIYQVMNSN